MDKPTGDSAMILVTGGCGFIGSNFIRHLYEKYPSYRIVNFDLLTYAGNSDNLTDITLKESAIPSALRRYSFIQGNINNKGQLDALFSKYAFFLVFNFAAETHVDRSIISMNNFLHTNVNGVWTLSEAIREHKIPRFVHISTDEVYGSVDTGYTDEKTPLNPSNPYSASKASGDLILRSFIRTHQMPALIVRGSNNYGPYQYPEKLIPLAVSNLIEKKKIPLHGDGRHVRSWLHVNDFCNAIDLVGHKGKIGEIYNVSGEERTNMDVLSIIAEHLNIPLEKNLCRVDDRPGSDLRYAPNSAKIRRELEWVPNFFFDKHIGDVVKWYTEAKPWWEAIKSRTEYAEHYERQSTGKWY
jgi:dTDP-glucose 4,6-dehydratase